MQNSRDLASADDVQKTTVQSSAPSALAHGRTGYKRLILMAIAAAVLALCFAEPLLDWFGFTMDSEFYSYMPLMPFITGYLIFIKRTELGGAIRPGWGGAVLTAGVAGAILAVYYHAIHTDWLPGDQDYLCIMTLSFLLLLLASAFVIFGTALIKSVTLPVALLIFMVPYPEAFQNGLESFFQHTSATTAHGFCSAAGTTCVQDGLDLVLRGPIPVSSKEITNAAGLVERWKSQSDPVSAWLWNGVPAPGQKIILNSPTSAFPEAATNVLLERLNQAVTGAAIYTPERFRGVELRPETASLLGDHATPENVMAANRLLLEDAYPNALSHMDFGLRVAPECSGIHSSQVLLITSLLAGYLFLITPWRKTFLAVFIIPLAIARNGFRVFVIGELCIHINHNMIDSWIHHHGGPVFFALSLIPFFLVLVWLKKSESKCQKPVQSQK